MRPMPNIILRINSSVNIKPTTPYIPPEQTNTHGEGRSDAAKDRGQDESFFHIIRWGSIVISFEGRLSEDEDSPE